MRQGKIRYYALSTFNAWQMIDALWTSDRLKGAAPVCNQVAYSLANRDAENEIVPACVHHGMSLMAFSPLGGGLLAGAGAVARPIIGARRWGYPGFNESQLKLAQAFAAICRKYGHLPTQLVLAWVMSRPAVSAAIIGPETAVELEASALACDLRLESRLLEELEALSPPYTPSLY